MVGYKRSVINLVLAKRALGTCTDCGAKGRIWSTRTSSEYPYSTEELCKNCSDTKKSKDSFEMAWSVVKEAPTEECKGCGLAHGSPNSEYCSEICERQNMKKSDDMLRDALARKLPPRKEFSEKEIEAMMGRRVLPPRKDPEDDPLVHRARKNLMEEKQRYGQ